MEPIRFADILFILITLVITFSILWMVNKGKNKTKKTADPSQPKSDETIDVN
ncbi:hypothetical protein [uncultured Desulfuromusa sp.]|uniref:hypothetical protein n=1 Tax=uncultured Desulfuromusa sp. TaxID=219183 RepID=UPI002AA5F6DE|nr:hypothetical protein [uncultured Desulfuromusa sp.]